MLDRLTIERMTALAGEGPILVAFSGGGDSVALLRLLATAFGVSRLHAAIVDHALRQGSDTDARRALGFAQAAGVTGDILTLTWPAGVRRAQAAARDARYAALCAYARGLGARVIAVAHSADDQAETVLMRAAGGSRWRGLAGMAAIAPAPLWPEGRDLALARPLLGVRRAALRAYLRAQDADWIEDPANANAAFERVRVRARLAQLEAGGFDPMRLADLAARIRPHAERLDADAGALIAAAARFEADRISLDPAAWSGSVEVRRRAFSVLLAAAAGAAREADTAAVARLEAQLMQPTFRGAALGGARVSKRGAALRLGRDPGALSGRAGVAPLPPLPLPVGVAAVWDGRLELTAAEPGWSVLLDGAAPILGKGERRVPVDAAPHRWLLPDRVRHSLAAH